MTHTTDDGVELTWLLVGLDREFTRDKPAGAWEEFYAERVTRHFAVISSMR